MEEIVHTHYYGLGGSTTHKHLCDGIHVHTTERNRGSNAGYKEGVGEIQDDSNAPEYISRSLNK